MAEPPAAGRDPGPTLADLGEWSLIQRLGAHAPAGQFEDDAALLPECADGVLVINTDVLVEGVHFSETTIGPVDLGWRAAAANLSDLAAMGCRTVVGLTVGLVAPPRTAWSWVEGVYQGLDAALGRHGGVLLGGDCSSGGQRVLAVTALGRLGEEGPIRRSDGRPGDALVSTGPHGLSRLGLALLLAERPMTVGEQEVDGSLAERAIGAHRRPEPRLDAVAALAASRPADLPWRVAGIDSSDGLAAAVRSLARSSHCDAVLERRWLPLDPAMAGLVEAERWCLGGGEDFELVLALDPGWADALLESLPGSRRIGALAAGKGVVRWSADGAPLGPETAGFSHFQ